MPGFLIRSVQYMTDDAFRLHNDGEHHLAIRLFSLVEVCLNRIVDEHLSLTAGCSSDPASRLSVYLRYMIDVVPSNWTYESFLLKVAGGSLWESSLSGTLNLTVAARQAQRS